MKWLGDIRTLIDRQPDIWEHSLPLAEELGLLPIVAQTLVLLEWLYDVTPDVTSRQIISGEPDAESLARFALRTLTRDVSEGERSIREHFKFRHYGRSLARRHGSRARVLGFLSICFLHPGDLSRWSLPPFFVFAMPLMRVINLVRRRWLSRRTVVKSREWPQAR